MRVLMLSWEFPPRVIGGISPHVYHLSMELAKLGAEVCVVTCDFPGAPDFEAIDGVHVHRVDSYRSPASDFASWVLMMNVNLEMHAAEIVKSGREKIDLIHAHDWLVATAAIGLKHIFRKPMVATIHSTEQGRRNGINTDYQKMIHRTADWLVHEAWRTICCSDYMASQVSYVLRLPRNNIDVIPNGVDLEEFTGYYDRAGFRNRFVRSDEKLILFVGRLVYEKGGTILIEAAQKILRSVNAKFVVVGDGYLRDELMRRAWDAGIGGKMYFTGFLDEKTLRLLYRTADVCVVPSLYEPFGIVALEAMVARTPVVVSGVGGLLEIVEHDKTGVVIYPDNADSLAWGVIKVLKDESYANWIRSNAYQKIVDVYGWRRIAKRTLRFYERVLGEYEAGGWKPT